MKKLSKYASVSILIFIISSFNILSATNYVSKTGGHVSPFTSWANAATSIQDAVDSASAGNTILVNDGTYYPVSLIYVTNDVLVKSLNGAEKTVVDGKYSSTHFYINKNDVIDGFKITRNFHVGVICGLKKSVA